MDLSSFCKITGLLTIRRKKNLCCYFDLLSWITLHAEVYRPFLPVANSSNNLPIYMFNCPAVGANGHMLMCL